MTVFADGVGRYPEGTVDFFRILDDGSPANGASFAVRPCDSIEDEVWRLLAVWGPERRVA